MTIKRVFSRMSRYNRQRAVFAVTLLFSFTMTAGRYMQAQSFTVLHTFTNVPDGAIPFAGLTIDIAGNLYGTTAFGGHRGTDICATGCGTVYKLTRSDSGWEIAVLYAFDPPSGDGLSPSSRVVFGPDGALYGETYQGGAHSTGTVFRLAPSHACVTTPCFWEESLYSFPGDYTDGYAPESDVAFDRGGNLYGTTRLGGVGSCDNDPESCGIVFEILAPVLQWRESVIYDFTQSTGYQPHSGVLFDSTGNMFGTTAAGGADDSGTVYELVQSGGSWTQRVLYSFTGQSDGYHPIGALIQDGAGNLYGSTAGGGSGGGGTVFELSLVGDNWTYKLIHSLSGNGGPVAALSMDGLGNLYGTTETGGIFGFGNVFKLTQSNGDWTYTSLHDFANRADGAYPISNVVIDTAGNLYGTASSGGFLGPFCGGGCGVVWEITP
jgi:uncharacterized repeat protein (TIGR03803 family)